MLKKALSIWHYYVLFAISAFLWAWFSKPVQDNTDLFRPVVDGVIGGLVTSALLLFFAVIWKKNITPWVENTLYKDTKIEGVWRGILVPYLGAEEVDKMVTSIAMAELSKRMLERSIKAKKEQGKYSPSSSEVELSATEILETSNDKPERPISAQLILRSDASDEQKTNSAKKTAESGNEETITIIVKQPIIEIRVELFRTGHAVTGRVVEIGGASQIHTYAINGSFRNLILTGQYENESNEHIDRGSFSLMLVHNGKKMEGFFASYSDSKHRIFPFKCILNRHGDLQKHDATKA